MKAERISERAALLLILAVWLLAWGLVDPRGEFPLNDDWAYTAAVQTLAEEGRFDPLDWGAMTLFSHVVWGAAATAVFGFSFLVLRLGTLAFGLLGLWAFHGILGHAALAPRAKLLAVAALAFNPIYFHLTHTFMTDVPFLALALSAVLAYLTWLRSGRGWALAGSIALIVAATLIRQVGLAIGFGLAASLLLRPPGERRWRAAAAAAGVPVLALLAYSVVGQATFGLPEASVQASAQFLGPLEWGPARTLKVFLPRVFWCGLASFVLLGIFCLPIAPGCAGRARLRPGPEKTASWIAAAIGLTVMVVLVSTGSFLPHFGDRLPLGNIITWAGIGPLTLLHPLAGGSAPIPAIPTWIWTALTLVGCASGAVVFQRCIIQAWNALRNARPRGAEVGIEALRTRLSVVGLTTGIFYVAPFFMTWVFFDRYVLFLVPFALWIAARPQPAPPPWALRAGAGVVAAMALFALVGTHDYLSWNRARWALLEETVSNGTDLDDIDGGFEFNMWHRYEPGATPDSVRGTGRLVLSYGPLPGYQVRETARYPRWMRPGDGELVLLERSGRAAGSP